MADQLTQEQIDAFKEAFIQSDKNQEGAINSKDLVNVLKSLGQNPTDQEVTDMLNEVDPENGGSIDFPEFLSLMAKKMKDNDSYEELIEAFKIFDPEGLGVVSAAEFRYLIMNMGEKLTQEEAEEMIKDTEPNQDGFIKYEDFVKKITGKQ